MNKGPGISVVMPVYNGMPLLKESVESVLAQKDALFQLVIGEDRSGDDSYDYLSSLTDPRVKLMRHKHNLGLFGNLNALIRETDFELMHLWLQDDIMLPGCLQKTIAYHQQYREVGYAFCKYIFIDGSGRELGRNEVTHHQFMSVEGHAITSLVTGSAPGNISSVSLRKKNIEQVGYFDESMKYAGDFDMWCKLTAENPVGMIQEYLIKLRRHPRQLSRSSGMWIHRLRENKAIYDEFLKRVPESKVKYVRRGLTWRIYTQYVGLLFKLIRTKEYGLAGAYFREFNAQKSIAPVALYYLILLVARKMGCHRKLLSKIYYKKL
jgi:glycosyltransferase involved in cell wall biosynthesis